MFFGKSISAGILFQKNRFRSLSPQLSFDKINLTMANLFCQTRKHSFHCTSSYVNKNKRENPNVISQTFPIIPHITCSLGYTGEWRFSIPSSSKNEIIKMKKIIFFSGTHSLSSDSQKLRDKI